MCCWSEVCCSACVLEHERTTLRTERVKHTHRCMETGSKQCLGRGHMCRVQQTLHPMNHGFSHVS